jgi:N-acetyl-anhydromuramyl-L-alanine amidase AmpD
MSLGCPRADEHPDDAKAPSAGERAPAIVAPRPAAREPREFPPAHASPDAHDAIVIAGERFSIGAPVVLWSDPDGYSAYSTTAFFDSEPRADGPAGLRYLPGRKVDGVDVPEPTLDELKQVIDQFVLHFDVCGVSRQCFKVLQDIRGLSVHFMLDIDGTLYQTLDLRETAWHARQANPRSIGVEIANMGGYAPAHGSALDTWYVQDDQGWRIQIPERLGDGGVRSADFIGRPARPERIQGVVQGEAFEQFDFTPQQYDTLEKLAAMLCRVLPRIEPDAPRDEHGRVRTDALSPEEFEDFHGILGHLHVTREKNDPGPALDWEKLLNGVRERL